MSRPRILLKITLCWTEFAEAALLQYSAGCGGRLESLFHSSIESNLVKSGQNQTHGIGRHDSIFQFPF